MGQTSMNAVHAPASGTFLRDGRREGVALTRHVPPDDLAEIVEHVTLTSWDLERGRTHEREIVPVPSVELGFGDHRPGVHGPVAQRTITRLTRSGSSVLIGFRPGAFRALLRGGVEPSRLVDRPSTFEEVLAAAAAAKALRDELTFASDDTKLGLVHGFLRAHHPGLDDGDREVNELVDVARFDPTLTRVAKLAEHAGRPVRALERLFRSRIGVSAKWVIRHFRIRETATRIAKGLRIDLDALAFLLGYGRDALADDFRAQTGRSLSALTSLAAGYSDTRLARCASANR